MKNKKSKAGSIPVEFTSYEEAADFWDTHDTADYPEVFETVDAKTELRKRHYEVEVDDDVIKFLKKKSHKLGVPISPLINDMLRKQISRIA